MRRRSRFATIVVWLLAVFACVAFVAPQTPANIWVYQYNNKYYPRVRWKKDKKKLKVYIAKKTVGGKSKEEREENQKQFTDDCENAMKSWNAHSGETGVEFETTTDPKQADVFIGEKDLPNMGDDHLGETHIGYAADGSTKQAVVWIDNDGAMKGWEKPGDSQADKEKKHNRQSTIEHELGHVLGAGHSPNKADTMHPTQDAKTDQDRKLTGNDVKEAKAACSIHEKRRMQPDEFNLIREEPEERKDFKDTSGQDYNLGSATDVQFHALDPGGLVVDPSTVEWSGNTISVCLHATADADMQEAIVATITYADGTVREYGTVFFVNDDPPPADMPHAVVPSTVIVAEAGEPILFDGFNSYHDNPDEQLWYSWNIEGVVSSADPYFECVLDPGVYHGTFQVMDRWGRFDSVELDITVGVSEVWIEEPVYPIPGGAFSDICIDSQGTAHVAHGCFETGQVSYSYRTQDGWVTEPVALAAPDNQYVSLALTPDDEPQIVYYDANMGMPFYAERVGPGAWYVEPIPGIGGLNYGDMCDIATDSQGMPHVTFVDYDLQEVAYSTYVPGLRGHWVTEPVDFIGNANAWPKLAVNDYDEPCITYKRWNRLFYAEKDGGLWQHELITNTADGEAHDTPAMSMDAEDIPNIVYETDTEQLTIARRIGGEWSYETTVPSGTTVTMLASLSFDTAPPRVSWYRVKGRAGLEVSYATKRGDTWTTEVYDPDTGTQAVGGISMAVDSGGNPWISYMASDGVIDYLRVAYRKPLGKMLTSPPEAFNGGFNWFSIPWTPTVSSEMSDVLGFNARNKVFRWDPIVKNLELYPDDFTDIEVGRGYKMWLPDPIDVSYWATPGPDEVEVPAPGFTWVGVPATHDVFQGDIVIYNAALDEYRTVEDDATEPDGERWLNPNWVYWNSVDRTAEICVFNGSGDDTYVRPWRQYQVWSHVGGLTLYFP
jgi:hypothetical protein